MSFFYYLFKQTNFVQRLAISFSLVSLAAAKIVWRGVQRILQVDHFCVFLVSVSFLGFLDVVARHLPDERKEAYYIVNFIR